jgi:hypothetical protein
MTVDASNMVQAYKCGFSGDDDVDTDDVVRPNIEIAPNNDMNTFDGKRIFSLESKMPRRKQSYYYLL